MAAGPLLRGRAGRRTRLRGDLLRPRQVLRVGHPSEGLGGVAAMGLQSSRHADRPQDLQHGAAHRPGR
eukprot:5245604-Pyramimonas_sp.AAC.1